jgi:tRNA pseudouridine55 synthase
MMKVMKKIELSKVHGFLLLDKPTGMTSNAVLQKLKFLFSAKKAGHTGSLDPLATGMLPICFGEASKFSQYLLDANKCYQVTGLLGMRTTTADAHGEVIETCEDVNVSQKKLQEVVDTFQGQQDQIPTMYSALKHKGRPLYEYARAGIVIERKPRKIDIMAIDLLQFDGRHFKLFVKCSKGTYIRNLIEDIGFALGVGAHVTELHRVYTAGFENYQMYSLEAIQKMSLEERWACLLPMDLAVNQLEKLSLKEEEVSIIRQGKFLKKQVVNQVDQPFRLYDEQGVFLGLGVQKNEQEIKAKRLISEAALESY